MSKKVVSSNGSAMTGYQTSTSYRVSSKGKRYSVETFIPTYATRKKEVSRNYSILNIVFLILLVTALFQLLNGVTSQRLTFSGFLNWAKDFNPAFSNVALVDNSIGGSWGLFDFLRIFINVIVHAFDFMVWLSKIFMNLISYVAGVTRFLFGI